MVMTLTIGTLALIALVAACAKPAAESPAPPQITDNKVRTVSDLERTEAMQSSNQMLINDYFNRGQEVPEYLFEQNQEIEQAKRILRQLDGQREGLSMLVMQYWLEGATAPDCVSDQLHSVEQSRQETLNKIGLYQ